MIVNKHFELLGMIAKDKVTNAQGVVASISFDLYGCIQALVNLGIDENGKMKEQYWLDVNRLDIIDGPVMARPNFEFEHGPAEKPTSMKI